MNTRDLEAFHAVVETGSIVGAAARLHLTQSGVSRRIQSLEEGLGVQLLDRQSKPLKPTAAGRDTYAHGRRMLRALDDLKAGISTEGALQGEFRIGITPYLSELAVTEPLDALRGSYPDLTLCVTTGWPEPLLAQVRRGEIDVAAFCLPEGTAPPPALECSPFGLQALVVVAPRDAAIAAQSTLADLSHWPWVINPDGCGFRMALQRQLDAARLPLRVGVEALSSELRLSLVARGLGLGLSTAQALAASAWRDRLRVVAVRDFVPCVQAWLVHRAPVGRLARPLALFEQTLRRAIEGEIDGTDSMGDLPAIDSPR